MISKTDVDHKPVHVDGFVIDCYNLVFDGSSFGPKFTSISIRKFVFLYLRPEILAAEFFISGTNHRADFLAQDISLLYPFSP